MRNKTEYREKLNVGSSVFRNDNVEKRIENKWLNMNN